MPDDYYDEAAIWDLPTPRRYNLPPPAKRDWADRANCRGADISIFYPKGRLSVQRSTVTPQAAALCRTCVVRSDCIRASLGVYEYGCWGGLSEAQRNAARLVALERQAAHSAPSV
ncbi:MAG: WhiB family transcriptional regulator [Bryobacteraceae bacterium]